MTTAVQTRLLDSFTRFRTGTRMRDRAARGGLWLATGSAGENGMRLLRNMILARVFQRYFPGGEPFALIAIITSVSAFFEAFTELGVREAIIQSPQGAERKYLNGAWFLSAGRGLFLYICAVIAAPYIAAFFEKPEIVPMMYLAFTIILINGAMSPLSYVAQKELNFRRWVVLWHGGGMVGIATAIVLGVILKNAWALVIGLTVEAAARCIASYVICPFRPRLDFDRDSLRALFKFAKGMFGLPVLAYIYLNADTLVIARTRPDEELALYTLGLALIQIPWILCTTVIKPILLPAFSSVQNDRERFSNHILQSTRFISLAFLPGLTLMACLAPIILRLAYGPDYNYDLVIRAFQILCFGVAVRIIGVVLVNVYFAVGRPELNRWASFVRVVVIALMIVPMVKQFGLVGAALTILVCSIVWMLFNLLYLKRCTGLRPLQYLASFGWGAAISLAILGGWQLFA